MKKDLKQYYPYIIIMIVSFISLLPLITKTNIWGHDTNFHLANIKSISESITLTNLFPKISKYNLGYGTHLFYAPLPHYLGSYLYLILKHIGFNVCDTLALIYYLISCISGIIMYHLSKDITKNNYCAIASSIIYILMPYFMGDMIVRCAYNEVFSFIFIPIIILSLNRLLDDKSFLWYFVIGYTGLIYSHIVLALYTSIFLIPWIIINYKSINNRNIISKLIRGIIIVSLLSLPFIITMLNQKIGGNYLVFKDNYLSSIDYVISFNNSLKDYLIPIKDYSWEVPLYINILVIISFIVSVIYISKHKLFNNKIIYLLILLIISFIMTLDIFPWKYLPSILYMVQFPWRLEIFVCISLSVISPLFIGRFKKQIRICLILIILVLISEIPFIVKLSSHKYLTNSDIDYKYEMGHSNEYLPINAYKNIKYFNNRDNTIKCSNCESQIIKDNSEILSFEIKGKDEYIELPRLYYVGYTLYDSRGKKIDISENKYGFICAYTNTGTYKLVYTGTILYRFFYHLRFICLIYIGYLVYTKKKI